MHTSSSASDRSATFGGRWARRAALLASVLLTDCQRVGCGDRRRYDAVLDARPAVRDGGDRQDGGPGADAAPAAPDAGRDATAAICPPWRQRPPVGRGWIYVRALASNGVPLSPTANDVDIYVRRAGDPLPGERADADDPCAVASYDQTAPKVRVVAAAIGFSSQEREFSPPECLETSPCSVELPRSLDARYYRALATGVRVRSADDVPEGERVAFAAAVASDALARSKALHRPLADELDRTGEATSVPALDLAIHYTEARLRKRCDASCVDEPALDPAVRTYLKGVRSVRRSDVFELRTPPDRWRSR